MGSMQAGPCGFEGHGPPQYREFLERKSQLGGRSGFAPLWIPDFLFDFQKAYVDWVTRTGKSACLADCGLGKTNIQLVWAENVCRKTDRPVLILTPLAVSSQTAQEAEKFGMDCRQSRTGEVMPRITVTNYERLHYFNSSDFAGVVLDESSCIKAFDGKRRKEITRFMSKVEYRLLCTATPSPNDFIELGTSSEALGYLTQSEMLSLFFRSSDNARHSLFREGDFWNRAKWFFKPHAAVPFWRWVCSWSRAMRTPSDWGFEDGPFILPPLIVNQHVVECNDLLDGELFVRVAVTLREQREERRKTITQRCEKVAELVRHDKPAIVWCQYNEEGDLLEKLIPGCVQVAGKDSDEDKEARLTDFRLGNVRVLVTKPKIGAWGLNFQHCGHHTFFPSHSFEQWYQSIRRSLRFGRVGPVVADIVTTEGEAGVTENLQKKQRKADEMFAALVAEMNDAEVRRIPDAHVVPMEVPAWL